ncbi:MAG: hypothetical protein ACJ8R9_20105 [Steroidobacteraceae bacterium]
MTSCSGRGTRIGSGALGAVWSIPAETLRPHLYPTRVQCGRSAQRHHHTGRRGLDIPPGSGRTWSGFSACWQLAPIRPRVAERISFDEVAEAHRRLEADGLQGKLVLCPNLRPP